MTISASPRLSWLAHLRQFRPPHLPARAVVAASGLACTAAVLVAAWGQRS